jgi:hypothetical protein
MAITKGTKWYMPIDFGISEAYQRKTGKQIGDYNPAQNPGQNAFDNSGTQNLQTIQTGGTIPVNPTHGSSGTWEEDVKKSSGSTNTNTNQTQTGGIDQTVQRAIQLAQDAYNERINTARNAFGRARGIYDEGISGLKNKREQFGKEYETGMSDINASTEQGRGQLQASAQGQQTRMLNALRAMGMGGSAFQRGQGSINQQNAQNLGSLNTQRMMNERENTKTRDANLDWANTQESALGRYLQDAAEAQRQAEEQSSLIQRGDANTIQSNMQNSINDIINFQQAMAQSAAQNGNYNNPFMSNLGSYVNTMNDATSQIPNSATETTGVGNNLAINPYSLNINDLIRRAGGSLYGSQ